MEMASRPQAKRLEKEARRGDVERVAQLLDDGADIDRLGSHGMTPLMRAAYDGHEDVVRELLKRGADPNKGSKSSATALFWACRNGHEVIAEMLLAAGADINATREGALPNEPGPSVLAIAISKAPATLIEKLVRAGASLDYRYMSRNMLEHADWCGRSDLRAVLRPNRGRARK